MRNRKEIEAQSSHHANLSNDLFKLSYMNHNDPLWTKCCIESAKSIALNDVIWNDYNEHELDLMIAKTQARLDAMLWAKGE